MWSAKWLAQSKCSMSKSFENEPSSVLGTYDFQGKKKPKIPTSLSAHSSKGWGIKNVNNATC